jgi:hypothetical protein
MSLCHPVFAQSIKKEYTLKECYISALKHAERIGIAKEAIAIAEFTRKQALSVLFRLGICAEGLQAGA